MIYKIGLVSTQGTGKTSLAGTVEGGLKSRGLEAIYLREISAQAKKIGLPINEDTTYGAQLWILHSQFAQEIEYAERRPQGPNYDVLICDRGPDNYCYLKRRFGEDRYALELTLGHVERFPYSKIYFLPIVDNSILPGAGVRSIDPAFQAEMDKEIRTFLDQHQIKYTELPRPDTADPFRNEWAKLVINQTLRDLEKSEALHIR